MSTAEERFDLALKSVEMVTNLAEDMNKIGIYGEDEFKSAAVLLMSLSRAMNILDPDRAKEYREDVLSNNPSLSQSFDRLGNTGNGPYL